MERANRFFLKEEDKQRLDNYTTRFLDESDLEVYLELLGETKTFMGKPYNKEEDREYAVKMFFDPNNRVSGTFDADNKLLTVISGYYFPNFPHWYVYRVFQRMTDRSLASGIRNFMLLFKTLRPLIDYGEENHYYSYYNKFTLEHQIAWEKGYRLLADKSKFNYTYTYHWEEVYMPGEGCKHRNHQFFFEMEKTVSVPCVITLCVLNQETRRQYFNQRYGLKEETNHLG
jgi:hypothetical protein